MILIRYGEIALKGKNRFIFENKLVSNIRLILKNNDIKFDSIKKIRGRIIIDTEEAPDLSKVFGIVNFSYAKQCNSDMDSIKESVDFSKINENVKFRVTAKRQYKEFPLKSPQIERELGSYIVEKTNAKVSLQKFDIEIGVEVYKDRAFVFAGKHPAKGGMPLGSSGTAICYIEKEEDLLAAYMMMRRGCCIIMTGNHVDINWLQKYNTEKEFKFFESKDMEEIEKYAADNNIDILILGQTLENIEVKSNKLIEIRPLVGIDNITEEIEELK